MLKYVLDNLDGVDDVTKAFYTEGEGGKFYLGVEGLPEAKPAEDVDGMKKKLEELLKEKKKADQVAKEARELAEKEREEKLRAAGDVKGLEEGLNKRYTEQIAELTATSEAKLKERDKWIEDLTVTAAAQNLAASIVKKPEYVEVLLPHILKRLRVDVTDGKPKPVVVDLSDNRTGQTLDDLKKEFISKPAFAELVACSKASGAGHQSTGGGAAGGSAGKKPEEYTGAEIVKLSKENPAEYDRVIKAREKLKQKIKVR